MTDPGLDVLLTQHHHALLAFLRRDARGLARFESPEDLAQAVHARALENESPFEFRGEAEFLGWLFTVARRHVADRHEYWSALKRGAGQVARLTLGAGSRVDPAAVLVPPAAITGPSTFASRRELLVLCARALAALPPRDQDLVRWRSEGVSVREQAARLGLSEAAAQRGGLRAVERFRKAFELASRAGTRLSR